MDLNEPSSPISSSSGPSPVNAKLEKMFEQLNGLTRILTGFTKAMEERIVSS